MQRSVNKLTDRKVRSLGPGFHSDGQCLYLNVERTGSKNWIFRTAKGGRQRDWGFGGFPSTTLKDARKLRDKAHEAISLGQCVEDAIRPKKTPSFLQVAEQCFKDRDPLKSFSPITRREWEKLIWERAACLHKREISTITKHDILKIVQPLWATKYETARKSLSRLKIIMDYAKSTGVYNGDNPAVWSGNLESHLRKPRRTVNFIESGHKFLPYDEVPEFMDKLTGFSLTSATALKFTVLTAARTSMVLRAQWSEVDFENRAWEISAQRMKNRIGHKVPLSNQALRILEGLWLKRNSDYVFANLRGKPLSKDSMRQLLRKKWVFRRKSSPFTVLEHRFGFGLLNRQNAVLKRQSGQLRTCAAIARYVHTIERRDSMRESR